MMSQHFQVDFDFLRRLFFSNFNSNFLATILHQLMMIQFFSQYSSILVFQYYASVHDLNLGKEKGVWKKGGNCKKFLKFSRRCLRMCINSKPCSQCQLDLESCISSEEPQRDHVESNCLQDAARKCQDPGKMANACFWCINAHCAHYKIDESFS